MTRKGGRFGDWTRQQFLNECARNGFVFENGFLKCTETGATFGMLVRGGPILQWRYRDSLQGAMAKRAEAAQRVG